MSKKIRVGNGTVRTAERPVRPKKAYITGPRLSDTAGVRRVLEAKGVSTFSPDELNLPSQNLTQVMREAMERADLVVALVDSTKESNLVFYELGVAQALRKPAVVFLTKDASPDTWVACGVPCFRFDPLSPTSLEFGIDQVLSLPRRATKPRPLAEKQTHPIGELADQLLERLRKAGGKLTGHEFTSLIEDTIRASGVSIVSMNDRADKGIDLAAWCDDLSPWVSNPLLIELKVRPSGPSALSDSAENLTRALSSSGMHWGLLIYHGSPFDRSIVPAPPNILTIQAERFIEDLRETGFADLVHRLRNQRVHGVVEMPRYSRAKIKAFLRTWDTAATKAARGKAFEGLACYLFEKIPGIRITSRNEKNTFATEEIDIACCNDQHPKGLRHLDAFFLVECKGWTEPVNSEQVAWFLTKIEHRGNYFGVLLAANGITGVTEHLEASNFLVAVSLAAKKIRMVIINRTEIETLASGEELAALIIAKVTQLHSSGGKCY